MNESTSRKRKLNVKRKTTKKKYALLRCRLKKNLPNGKQRENELRKSTKKLKWLSREVKRSAIAPPKLKV